MSLRGAAVSISMQISTNKTYTILQQRGHNGWQRRLKTSRDTLISKSITIDHSVKIRGPGGGEAGGGSMR